MSNIEWIQTVLSIQKTFVLFKKTSWNLMHLLWANKTFYQADHEKLAISQHRRHQELSDEIDYMQGSFSILMIELIEFVDDAAKNRKEKPKS